MVKNIILLFFLLFFANREANSGVYKNASHLPHKDPSSILNTAELIAFAKSFIGTHYKFGASNPKIGFDCSGFVYYVFKHFGITVPRQSAAFKNEGKTVKLDEAIPGDVILFTGTRAGTKTIGHIGIITSSEGENIRFIHASSGAVRQVVETPLDNRYKNRFVKIIRLL